MSFNLAEQVRGDVGAASIAVMDKGAASAVRDIAVITAEIQDYKARGGEVLLEIGKRLCEAKAMLDHGAWLKWLADEVDFSERSAQELMQIARRFPNPRALADLGKTKVLKLLLLPDGEREEFIETHDVAGMSSRELEQAIKERDEARARADGLESVTDELRRRIESADQEALDLRAAKIKAENRLHEIESAPKEVYRDEAAIEAEEDVARQASAAEIAKLRRELDEAREQTARAMAEARQAAAEPEHKCVTGFNPHGSCGAASYCDKPYSCCIACPDHCNSYCGFLPELADTERADALAQEKNEFDAYVLSLAESKEKENKDKREKLERATLHWERLREAVRASGAADEDVVRAFCCENDQRKPIGEDQLTDYRVAFSGRDDYSAMMYWFNKEESPYEGFDTFDFLHVADLLGCSADYLLGRSPVREIAREAQA